MKHHIIIALGFILYLYDGQTHKSINRDPFYIFPTSEECKRDLDTWKRIAPEWIGDCREAQPTTRVKP